MAAYRKFAALVTMSAILYSGLTFDILEKGYASIAYAGMGTGKDKMNWAKRRRDWCAKNPDKESCSYLIYYPCDEMLEDQYRALCARMPKGVMFAIAGVRCGRRTPC